MSTIVFAVSRFGKAIFRKLYLCLPESLMFVIIKMIPAFFR
jgi:hypothetical protein